VTGSSLRLFTIIRAQTRSLDLTDIERSAISGGFNPGSAARAAATEARHHGCSGPRAGIGLSRHEPTRRNPCR
jgi:hypothetical protein